MMKQYDPKQIEPKWQQVWEETKLYRTKDFDNRPKQYVLAEFPYPSGDGLHVGHVRRYTASDILARWYRMRGFNVLHPIGWDAFGLPTENFAIKTKTAPQTVTKNNVDIFRRQLKALGFGFDWEREVNTTNPDYYKWTQWLFLQFFKKDLAYQKEMPVNWCPKCKVGLADEEVVSGRHERCDTPVEKKLLNQWMLKITAYADRLINDLKTVDYPEKVSSQQINWIGKSRGARITFQINGSDKVIEVFTTRPDTLFGATYIVLAPEHPLVEKITTAGQKKAVTDYLKQAQHKSDIERQEEQTEKDGVFTGAYAINPANDERIPIWMADYVLAGYGTGAIMAVPAHDQRDYEFAVKFNLPIRTVIEPVTGEKQENPEYRRSIVAVVENKNAELLSINWGPERGGYLFIGGGVDEGEDIVECAEREIAEETGYTDVEFVAQTETIHHHYFAKSKNTPRHIEATGLFFRLKSNRREEPKLEEDEKDKFKTEWISSDKAQKVVLDPLHRYVLDRLVFGKVYTGDGKAVNSGKYDGLESDQVRNRIVKDLSKHGQATEKVNYKLRDWIFSRQHYWGEPIPIIHCKKCGAVAVPEEQLPVTLPEVERYEPTDTGESPLAEIEEWVNTECPACGGQARRETDTMPNWAGSSWYYLRYTDSRNAVAFADQAKLNYWLMVDTYIGGMEHTTLHLLYSRFWHKFFYDQGLVPTPEPYCKRRPQGMILASDGKKMSKSLGNVINPDEIIDSGYGADSLRLLEMFLGPMHQDIVWTETGVAGTYRFLNRVWNLTQEYIEGGTETTTGNRSELETQLEYQKQLAIKKVTEDIIALQLNTAIAALMEYVNALYKAKEQLHPVTTNNTWTQAVGTLLQLLAPFAPHITEELWNQLGEPESIHIQPWPVYDPVKISEESVTLVVQINGKVRDRLVIAAGSGDDEVIGQAKASVRVKNELEGKEIVKSIVVPDKLVNFVVK